MDHRVLLSPFTIATCVNVQSKEAPTQLFWFLGSVRAEQENMERKWFVVAFFY